MDDKLHLKGAWSGSHDLCYFLGPRLSLESVKLGNSNSVCGFCQIVI